METLSKLHYLNIGPGGTFKADEAFSSTAEDVDALFKHLETIPQRKLILHFHGGLVSEKDGMGVAERMVRNYAEAGHAYSFVWQTGLMEVLKERFDRVQETGLFQELKKIIVRKVCEKLGIQENARGTAKLNKTEVELELAQPKPFEAMEARARGGAGKLQEAKLDDLEEELKVELEEELDTDTVIKGHLQPNKPDGQRGLAMGFLDNLAKIIIRVIRRYIRKREHGIVATSVEEILREFYVAEIGTVVWDGIKQKARSGMWLPNQGLAAEARHAGFYFLEKLNAFLGKHPGWKIDLIGHSAGSIAICHMLRTVAAEGFNNIKIRQIVLLAPACRTKLFHDEIVAHPERYERVRMYTMTDEKEQEDHLVPYVYPRSLLYLVSGILENKKDESDTDADEDDGDFFVLGLQRQLEERPPYQNSGMLRAVRAFFNPPHQVITSPTEVGPVNTGDFCCSIKHGNFDNDKDLLSSLTYLVTQ